MKKLFGVLILMSSTTTILAGEIVDIYDATNARINVQEKTQYLKKHLSVKDHYFDLNNMAQINEFSTQLEIPRDKSADFIEFSFVESNLDTIDENTSLFTLNEKNTKTSCGPVLVDINVQREKIFKTSQKNIILKLTGKLHNISNYINNNFGDRLTSDDIIEPAKVKKCIIEVLEKKAFNLKNSFTLDVASFKKVSEEQKAFGEGSYRPATSGAIQE